MPLKKLFRVSLRWVANKSKMFAKETSLCVPSQHDRGKRGEMCLMKIHKSSFKYLHIAHFADSKIAYKCNICMPISNESALKWNTRCSINTFIFIHFPFHCTLSHELWGCVCCICIGIMMMHQLSKNWAVNEIYIHFKINYDDELLSFTIFRVQFYSRKKTVRE